jgi:hypothetical protein
MEKGTPPVSAAAAAAASAVASPSSSGPPAEVNVSQNQPVPVKTMWTEIAKNNVYIKETMFLGKKFLEDEKLLRKSCVVDSENGKIWKVVDYLPQCVITFELLLQRHDVIKGKGYKLDTLTFLMSSIADVLVSAVNELHSKDLFKSVPWWEKTFSRSVKTETDFDYARDVILLAALAHGCPLVAKTFDQNTLFNTRQVEEVYGMWVVCQSDEIRVFIENMPSFKKIVDGKNVQSHWHCCYTNQWTGPVASTTIRDMCEHPENNPKVEMDFYEKLCIEDIERTVQTRDGDFTKRVLQRIKTIPFWQRHFINDNYGVCSFFKAMCCCIHMTSVPSNPYIATQESMDDVFDVLLGESEKMCADILSDSKYAFALIAETVYRQKYDYAVKMVNVFHASVSDEVYFEGLLLVVFQARQNVLILDDSDPAISFMRTFISAHREILERLRDHPQFDETFEYVIVPIEEPTP